MNSKQFDCFYRSQLFASVTSGGAENDKNVAEASNLNKDNPQQTSSSFYLGMIQMLEQAIKSKRKNNITRKENKSLMSSNSPEEKNLEMIQSHYENKEDRKNLNLLHSNCEEKFPTKNKSCFPNNDQYYEDIKVVSKDNLNTTVSLPGYDYPYSPMCARTTSSNETLDILNTYDTKTQYERDRCNLKEAEQKETNSIITQVDKTRHRLFLYKCSFSLYTIAANIYLPRSINSFVFS